MPTQTRLQKDLTERLKFPLALICSLFSLSRHLLLPFHGLSLSHPFAIRSSAQLSLYRPFLHEQRAASQGEMTAGSWAFFWLGDLSCEGRSPA
jgi:hypothetical protein